MASDMYERMQCMQYVTATCAHVFTCNEGHVAYLSQHV